MVAQTGRLCQGVEAVDRFLGLPILGFLHRANNVAVAEEELNSDRQCQLKSFRG